MEKYASCSASKSTPMKIDRIKEAQQKALQYLLSLKNEENYWESNLSSSALSTSVAAIALQFDDSKEHETMILCAVDWLERTQNTDGGWGDTPESPSNLWTTLITLSALLIVDRSEIDSCINIAKHYVAENAGNTSEEIVRAIANIYGEDRTFAAPILAVCALAGLVDWDQVPGLPFALALIPGSLYRLVKLQVVSYALPALIAVGLLIFIKSERVKPWHRFLIPMLLRKLECLQPESGGYLEAAPLTGFVAIGLAACGLKSSKIVENCVDFLVATVVADGSWKIDTNLSVWTTINAVSALRSSNIETINSIDWIANLQYKSVHPFTGASPGGWGWTYLAGSVPDADDTSGAVRILVGIGATEAIELGVQWLLKLQNTDGGMPTFCKGWGKLPFDQSSPDITAHALRAFVAAKQFRTSGNIDKALQAGLTYLKDNQREDGSWVPLWFGCQTAPDHQNPVYGTGRVLQALGELGEVEMSDRGVNYLISAMNKDGGWGGAKDCHSTVEETAVAVLGLAPHAVVNGVYDAVRRGVEYLVTKVEDSTWLESSPLGLYFASLWYSEDLYPITWTVEALSTSLPLLHRTPDNQCREQV